MGCCTAKGVFHIGRRVLIVEDDRDAREVLEALVRSSAHAQERISSFVEKRPPNYDE
jgi:hypothetical protein